MQGSQLTIYIANQNHRVHHRPIADWILDEAHQAGIAGATVVAVAEGVDTQGRYHAARFFELAEQSVAITVIAEDARIDALLERLAGGGARLFYTRAPIEFASLGGGDTAP
ncbi:conserved hypothetical protein [Paraburkholderia tropica]|uniref:DUF190 domain-containing protein n=1 Tax=Paraburkholderia TaxID=1822464 RepID=UPI001CB301E4|nr:MULTISPECIES: DUF190 domain-containing protein [Paraburkholderia]CAG9232114.1 conserved hypothetical protein [Paraburkholderia tropica]